jgi:hypothetical protein
VDELRLERDRRDNVTFTTIHMQLVATPMIAPTKIYDSVPDHLSRRGRRPHLRGAPLQAKVINTRLGTFGQVAHAVAPKAIDQVLHMAYRVFPDSSAAKGSKDGKDKASGEMVALAHLMKGVHW